MKNLAPVCNHFHRDETLFYYQYHPGGIGVAAAKGFNNIKEFWMKMKNDYKEF